MVRQIAAMDGPVYMRMGRNAVEDVYTPEQTQQLELGKANLLRDGTALTIIAAGEMVHYALEAARILEQEGIDARVLDMHTIKPLDETAVVDAARQTGAIVTVEEHSVYGGLGSAVAEVLCQNEPVRMKILGIPDTHVIAGESGEVFRYYGLDGAGIAKAAKALLEEK